MTKGERFETVYRKYYARVWRFYRANRVSDDESHDLAQEAFKRFYENIEKCRGEDEWPYLQTIARNVLYNWVRARKTAKRNAPIVDLDDPEIMLGEVAAAPQPDYAEVEQTAMRTEQLEKAMGGLSKGQRDVLLLSLHDMSYKAIAKFLGISLDAVKSRLRDAKRYLREQLGEKQP